MGGQFMSQAHSIQPGGDLSKNKQTLQATLELLKLDSSMHVEIYNGPICFQIT